MKKACKKLIVTGIIAIGCILMLTETKAEAARKFSEKTVTVTLDKKHQGKAIYWKPTKKFRGFKSEEQYRKYRRKYGIRVTIKVVAIKGNAKNGEVIRDFKGKYRDHICHFDLYGGDGCGPSYPYNYKKLKKGTILKDYNGPITKDCEDAYVGKNVLVGDYINRVKGIKKITYKITFKSVSGKKIIDYVKVKDAQKSQTEDGSDYYDARENYYSEWTE